MSCKGIVNCTPTIVSRHLKMQNIQTYHHQAQGICQNGMSLKLWLIILIAAGKHTKQYSSIKLCRQTRALVITSSPPLKVMTFNNHNPLSYSPVAKPSRTTLFTQLKVHQAIESILEESIRHFLNLLF